MVLLGEMRHWVRIRLALTRPYLGTASSRSNTFAVSRYSGGSSKSAWIWALPAFRSRFRRARWVRISLARLSASMRCVKDRSGAAPEVVLDGVSAAGEGIGGGHTTHGQGAVNAFRPLFFRIWLDLKSSFSAVRPT